MKEIGGYFELEKFSGPMLHEAALPLNCGRACIEYLIEQKQIKKIALPVFLCDVVRESCLKAGAEISYYSIGPDFMPVNLNPARGQWLYVTDFYGQLSQAQLVYLHQKYPNMIVDNAQAYFKPPLEGVDTLYTCRKFFGVPDGGFLYTDAPERELPTDISYDRMNFVLGRFEKNAGEFYSAASFNNDYFSSQPVKHMSVLTENLLRAIDYDSVKNKRSHNFSYLHKHLKDLNLLDIHPVDGAFAYPLMLENGAEYRKKLIQNKIFVPTLWPNVLNEAEKGSLEYKLAADVLPLPCDQRYTQEDMDIIISFFK